MIGKTFEELLAMAPEHKDDRFVSKALESLELHKTLGMEAVIPQLECVVVAAVLNTAGLKLMKAKQDYNQRYKYVEPDNVEVYIDVAINNFELTAIKVDGSTEPLTWCYKYNNTDRHVNKWQESPLKTNSSCLPYEILTSLNKDLKDQYTIFNPTEYNPDPILAMPIKYKDIERYKKIEVYNKMEQYPRHFWQRKSKMVWVKSKDTVEVLVNRTSYWILLHKW